MSAVSLAHQAHDELVGEPRVGGLHLGQGLPELLGGQGVVMLKL